MIIDDVEYDTEEWKFSGEEYQMNNLKYNLLL